MVRLLNETIDIKNKEWYKKWQNQSQMNQLIINL